MILVHLTGGLGNQMFQYACGRALADRLGQELLLDTTVYAHYANRDYALAGFAVTAAQMRPVQAQAIKQHLGIIQAGPRDRVKFLLQAPLVSRSRWTQIDEAQVSPDKLVATAAAARNSLLVGFFQNERYFQTSAATIRAEFVLRDSPESFVTHYQTAIKGAACPISLHIRRGDYFDEYQHIFAICTPDYYRAAADRLAEQFPEGCFFIFSDDPAWVQENVSLPYEHVIIPEQVAPHEAMYLMSQCQHHIMSNSSFSWWGVWLNDAAEKIVVLPDRWTLDDRITPADIIPEDWQTITISTEGN